MVPVVALVLLVGFAGCLSVGPGDSGEATPTVEPTESPPAAGSPTATPGENVSVEYVIESGGVPDEFESVTVSMRVVFTENTDDVRTDSCWRDTYIGPFRPTPTPLPAPDGDCHRAEEISVELTDLNGSQTFEATAPGRFDGGYALIVTDITATDQNGAWITSIKGIEGHRAEINRGPPDSPKTAEISIQSVDGRAYDYIIVSEVSESRR
jgi:hypothetical protein